MQQKVGEKKMFVIHLWWLFPILGLAVCLISSLKWFGVLGLVITSIFIGLLIYALFHKTRKNDQPEQSRKPFQLNGFQNLREELEEIWIDYQNNPVFRRLLESRRLLVFLVYLLVVIAFIYLPLILLVELIISLVIVIWISSNWIDPTTIDKRVKMPKGYHNTTPPPVTHPCKIGIVVFPMNDKPWLCVWGLLLPVAVYFGYRFHVLFPAIKTICSLGPYLNYREFQVQLGTILLSVGILLIYVPWFWFIAFVWKRYMTQVMEGRVISFVPVGWTGVGVYEASADILTIKVSKGQPKVYAFLGLIMLYFWEFWDPGFVFSGTEEVKSYLLPGWWQVWFEAYRATLPPK